MADYRLGDNWTLLGGFTRGWDNWEDVNGELGFLGGLEWCRSDGCESLRFALHSGNEDDLGENNRTVYSMVYYRRLNNRAAYVMEHNFGVEDNAASRENGEVPAHWYGITNYLVWQINCESEFGVRSRMVPRRGKCPRAGHSAGRRRRRKLRGHHRGHEHLPVGVPGTANPTRTALGLVGHASLNR